jgi:hypothetical protein
VGLGRRVGRDVINEEVKKNCGGRGDER